MNIITKQDYIDRLAKKYSDVSKESIRKIIDAGNKELLKNTKKKYTRVTSLAADRGHMHFYRHTGISINNKYRFNKRKKDAK
ncbi:MAG: hypothetical protein KAH32_04710 [Chlamydiia bacterium]|nr:hypothetical protein [Chlamydiia bacterium]